MRAPDCSDSSLIVLPPRPMMAPGDTHVRKGMLALWTAMRDAVHLLSVPRDIAADTDALMMRSVTYFFYGAKVRICSGAITIW